MRLVRSYRRRSDGVLVPGYLRRSPSARTGLGIAGIVGILAALTFFTPKGHSTGQSDSAPASPAAATSSAPGLGEGGHVVQVSSHRDAGLAEAEAARLRRRGLSAGVLRSERYRPYQSGFHVVYVGPYPSTGAGRVEADRVASTLPGSLVREVHVR
jgi:hypothetical protein